MSHKAKKHLGQNFLTDDKIIDRIVRVIKVQPDDRLVEIGPGQGALTSKLMTKPCKLTCVEFDPELVEMLIRAYPNLEVLYKDALAFDFAEFAGNHQIRVVGNLPYYISTPILFHLIEQKQCIQDMVFMLQKEVVDRICAEPGSKKYGRLSVMVQYACKTQHLFDVPAEAFDPKPKVQSAVVMLSPHKTSIFKQVPLSLLNEVVSCAFSLRRKTLRNALKPLFTEESLKALDIDLGARPETLSVATFVELAALLADNR